MPKISRRQDRFDAGELGKRWLGAGTADVLGEGVRRLHTADCSTGRKLEVGRSLLFHLTEK